MQKINKLIQVSSLICAGLICSTTFAGASCNKNNCNDPVEIKVNKNDSKPSCVIINKKVRSTGSIKMKGTYYKTCTSRRCAVALAKLHRQHPGRITSQNHLRCTNQAITLINTGKTKRLYLMSD